MKISEFLKTECINVDISPVESKTELFKTLLEIGKKHYEEINEKKALEGLLEREKLGSTGVGMEIAIPHAGIDQCDSIKPVLGIIKEGMNFESLDNLPVKIIFMILFPADNVSLQLKFLARVSRLLRKSELRRQIISADTPQEVMKIFKSYEDKHFG